MEHATPPMPRSAPRPGSADWVLEREYVEHRDAVTGSVRKQLFGRGIALDPADLEAVYNSAWHVLHQKLSAGEQVANRPGLLVVIMVRRVLSERRTLAGSNPPVPLDALGPVLADHAPEPAQQISDRERVRQLLEGLRERLSGRELQAATLCYLHGYTRPDAARLLDIPPKRMEKLMDRVSREISGVVRDVERGWCQANRSLITAYALGVLAASGPRHALAQEHLEHCAGCRRQVLVLRGMAALSPPAPLLGTGGGAAVVAGAVGGGAVVTLGASAPIGAGIAGALTGAAAIVGTVVVLGGGIAGSGIPPAADATDPRSALLATTPRGATVLGPATAFVADAASSPADGAGARRPADLPRHGAPGIGDAPTPGPAAGGPPGPVTSVSPELRAPSPSVVGGHPAAEREERRSHADGATATGSATGTATEVATDAGVADDGRRYASAEATASGPSAQADAGATAEAPDATVDSRARAAGESTSPVDVGARAHAEAGGTDPSHAGGSSEAWAIGGTDHAMLATAAETTVSGDDPATAQATSTVTGPSATSTASSSISDDDERSASGTATARSTAANAPQPSYVIPVPDDLVASFRWSATMAFFDAATQQQIQFDLGWLLAGLPDPGITLTLATVGGSGLDSSSLALAYGSGATTTATVTLTGGQAGAAAGTGDGRGWSVAVAVVDGATALATGGARGEGDGHGTHEALVDVTATTGGWASAISALLAANAGTPGQGDRQAVEVSALAQVARLLTPMLPAAGAALTDGIADGASASPTADRATAPTANGTDAPDHPSGVPATPTVEATERSAEPPDPARPDEREQVEEGASATDEPAPEPAGSPATPAPSPEPVRSASADVPAGLPPSTPADDGPDASNVDPEPTADGATVPVAEGVAPPADEPAGPQR